jgi:branched-chain amino acid aminotransferase
MSGVGGMGGGSKTVWMNGKLIPHAEAKIHVLTPAAKYGATVFEGICAYRAAEGGRTHVFRLPEHLDRLQDSMRIMRFEAEYPNATLTDIVLQVLRANGHEGDSHIRLSAWVDGEGAVYATSPIGLMCASVPRPARTLEQRAVQACVSSWRRIDDRSMPPRVKAAANYHNSRLAQLQARADGYDEALFLSNDGKVAEGWGACLFIVRDGVVHTTPITGGILESVTRDTVIRLLRDQLGMEVHERLIDRTELYVASEAFLCGSAYEVTPIRSVDRIPLKAGTPGPVTRAAWAAYEAAVRGAPGQAMRNEWLTVV